MNAHARIPTPQQDADFALELIRICSRRLKEIDSHVMAIGVALSQGRLQPRIALQLVERTAPGCVPAVYLSLFEGIAPEQLSARVFSSDGDQKQC
jgi:hypothetical protein